MRNAPGRSKARIYEGNFVTWRDAVLCAGLLLLPSPRRSTAPLIRLVPRLMSAWPIAIRSEHARRRLPDWLVGRSGPFGRGCFKVCEALCAYVLLALRWSLEGDAGLSVPGARVWWQLWPPPDTLSLGPMPRPIDWLIVLFLSGIVNAVLWMWSRGCRSRGDHSGIHGMVRGTVGRSLEWREHVRLAGLALGNAFCEEVVSRGFFFHEFAATGGLSPAVANVAQSISFGLWHYRGIPSGWVGVGLTFVYGLIMGALFLHGGGMALPILAHTIADYFIFTTIARGQFSGSIT